MSDLPVRDAARALDPAWPGLRQFWDLVGTRDVVESQGLAGLTRRIVSGERIEKPAALRWSTVVGGGA